MRVLAFWMVLAVMLQANIFEDYKDFARLMKYELDYEQARKKAIAQHKLLLVLYVKDGCPFCTKLEEEVLTDRDVRKFIKERYVSAIVNEYHKNFPDFLLSRIAPVTYIIEPKSQKVVKEIIGYMEMDQYLWQF